MLTRRLVIIGKYRFMLRHPFLRSKSYLYDLCRENPPDVAIETGVHGGTSSAYILQALSDNKQGHLYSIDLPEGVQPTGDVNRLRGKATGFLVPNRLRDRWDLILGDAKQKLPELVSKLEAVDFFHHDSLHTYEHMMFEFETVWPKLRNGGILASDDVNYNDAFNQFCEAHSLKPILHRLPYGYGGYAFK